MKKTYLLAPGPTPVPETVNLDMASPMIHHRTPQFSQVFAEAAEDAKYLFQTNQDVMILASTGTGAMEGCITNLFSPGDKVLVVNGGKFGERWGKISETYGLVPVWHKVEWGQCVKAEDLKDILDKEPDIKAILVQASETSTTVSHPIEEISKLTRDRDDLLLVVDGITAVGVYPLPMDAWGIDALVTGSQKALMLPPGLALVSFSEKAWKANESSKCPRFYFDLKKERKNLADKTTAYTPAVSLVTGLRSVLKNLREEGIDNVHKRHNRLARATRAAVIGIVKGDQAEAIMPHQPGRAKGLGGQQRGDLFQLAHAFLDRPQGIDVRPRTQLRPAQQPVLGAAVNADDVRVTDRTGHVRGVYRRHPARLADPVRQQSDLLSSLSAHKSALAQIGDPRHAAGQLPCIHLVSDDRMHGGIGRHQELTGQCRIAGPRQLRDQRGLDQCGQLSVAEVVQQDITLGLQPALLIGEGVAGMHPHHGYAGIRGAQPMQAAAVHALAELPGGADEGLAARRMHMRLARQLQCVIEVQQTPDALPVNEYAHVRSQSPA